MRELNKKLLISLLIVIVAVVLITLSSRLYQESPANQISSSQSILAAGNLLSKILSFFDLCGTANASTLVQVDASKNLGEMPETFFTGMEISQWGDKFLIDYYREKYLEENAVKVHRLGLNLESHVSSPSESRDDYMKRLESLDPIILDYYGKNGEFIFTIYGMPKWLSSRCNGLDNCSDRWNVAPPRDYNEWAGLVQDIVSHYKLGLGLNLMYEVWNEADQHYIFNADTFWVGTELEYFNLYEYAVKGARRADPTVKIGGPGSSVWDHNVISNFIKYSHEHNLPISFISWHDYIGWNNFYGSVSEYQQRTESIKYWLQNYGYDSQTPLIMDEWNYNPRFGKSLEHDTEFTSSYVVYAVSNMANGGIDRQTFFHLVDFENSSCFSGDLGSMCREGIIKPVYNSFKALSILNGKPENQTSNRLETIFNDNEFIAAISSQTRDKTKERILISNFFQNPREITINVRNLPFSGKATLIAYTIDKDHSNSCRYNYKTASDKSTPCGINGAVDKGIAQAQKEAEEKAMSEATDYLKTKGYTDQQISTIKSNLIEPCLKNENFEQCVIAKLQTFCSSFIQPAVYPSTCQILEQDLKDAYKVYSEAYNNLFYYGTYTNQKGQKMTTSIWIDKINNDPNVSLEGSKTTKEITITSGTYQETISLQPYSVVLAEISNSSFDTTPPAVPTGVRII